jgi:hypothetical protein
MRYSRLTRAWLLAAALILLPSAVGAQVNVNRRPPMVQTKSFDPKDPPAEMPPLKPGEAAVCQSKYACQVEVEVSISTAPGEKPTCKVTGIKADLALAVTIWLPKGATMKLRAHEEGHQKISEAYYANAEKTAKTLAEKYIGKSLEIASAETDDTRPVIQRVGHEFCQEYLGQIEVPSEKAQKRYDEITDHGRNKVSERDAIRRAIEWANRKTS